MGYLKLLPLRRRFKNNHGSKIQQSTDRLVVATECRANQKRVGANTTIQQDKE